MTDGTVEVAAPAKINPWLEVVARRDDGFHELDSWFLALDWRDLVRVRRRDDDRIALRGGGPAWSDDVPLDATNLVWRAVDAARRELECEDVGFDVELEKHVPSGAGLGGGSADAAAALRAVEIALSTTLPETRAADLLGTLGSDCNFFRSAEDTGFAHCKGRGEHVTAAVLPDTSWSIVVLVPGVHVPTAGVYRGLAFPLRPPSPTPSLAAVDFAANQGNLRAKLFNRLESIALQQFPRLRAWRDVLDRNGAEHFRMSGSGSAFFGFFRDADDAEACRRRVERALEAQELVHRGLRRTAPAGSGATVVS